MTTRNRRGRQRDWSAFVVFGIVYLAALALIVSPGSLRAVAPDAMTSAFPTSKGDP